MRITGSQNKHIPRIIESIIHESGHGIYLQNLPLKHKNDLIGNVAGYLIDESQALLWEHCVSKSMKFSKFLAKTIYEVFNITIGEYDYFITANYVRSRSTRVECDELSYALHIMMRYEIEKNLIEGDIEVYDIPKMWAFLSKDYGIDCSEYGCLEGIQWYIGHIGYFPVYLLGAMCSYQFYNTIVNQNNNINIAAGQFDVISSFLKQNIYNKGHIYDSNDLITSVTNEGLSHKYYLQSLKEKYDDFIHIPKN